MKEENHRYILVNYKVVQNSGIIKRSFFKCIDKIYLFSKNGDGKKQKNKKTTIQTQTLNIVKNETRKIQDQRDWTNQ